MRREQQARLCTARHLLSVCVCTLARYLMKVMEGHGRSWKGHGRGSEGAWKVRVCTLAWYLMEVGTRGWGQARLEKSVACTSKGSIGALPRPVVAWHLGRLSRVRSEYWARTSASGSLASRPVKSS